MRLICRKSRATFAGQIKWEQDRRHTNKGYRCLPSLLIQSLVQVWVSKDICNDPNRKAHQATLFARLCLFHGIDSSLLALGLCQNPRSLTSSSSAFTDSSIASAISFVVPENNSKVSPVLQTKITTLANHFTKTDIHITGRFHLLPTLRRDIDGEEWNNLLNSHKPLLHLPTRQALHKGR